MNGELITTAFTYHQGRIALNEAFSGQASFNIISATTFFSGTTDLSSYFASITPNQINWLSGSSGNFSIKSANNTTTDAYGNYSLAHGKDIIVSGTNLVGLGGDSNTISESTNSSIVGGEFNHIYYSNNSTTLGGSHNTLSGDPGAYSKYLLTFGNNNTINNGSESSSILGGGYNYLDYYVMSSSILAGQNNRINSNVTNSIILGGNSITAYTDNMVYVPSLNIQNVNTGNSIVNLAIDASGNTISGGRKTFQTLDPNGVIIWDYFLGFNAVVTLTGNSDLNIINANDGDYGTIIVVQDGTGGHSIGLQGPKRVVNGGAGSVMLSPAPGSQDILSFVKLHNAYYWNVGYNYN